MKPTNILVLIISVLTISVWSCKPKQVVVEEEVEIVVEDASEVVAEDDCNYKTIEGKGVITRMNFSNSDNIVINFNFIPSKSSGLEASEGHLFNVKGIGKYPPKTWCEKNGIEQGATFKVHQYVLANNSDREKCEKMKFSFVEFEDKGWK